jgi:hypothetical protein
MVCPAYSEEFPGFLAVSLFLMGEVFGVLPYHNWAKKAD